MSDEDLGCSQTAFDVLQAEVLHLQTENEVFRAQMAAARGVLDTMEHRPACEKRWNHEASCGCGLFRLRYLLSVG